ncbi:MAG: hypothetical protein WKF73_15140 [Nocardioidaceae bacterium]
MTERAVNAEDALDRGEEGEVSDAPRRVRSSTFAHHGVTMRLAQFLIPAATDQAVVPLRILPRSED